MDSRKYEDWTWIGSHDQFSALQIWNWNWTLTPWIKTILILVSEFPYGTVKYVIDSIQDNTEIPADPQEEQFSQTSTSVVAARSKAKAKPQPKALVGTTATIPIHERRWIDIEPSKTKSCLVRSLEESDQSSSTQSNVTARGRWSNWILQDKISSSRWSFTNTELVRWSMESLFGCMRRCKRISVLFWELILEQLSNSVLFKDILEAISLILRYRTCGDWNWNIPLQLPRRMHIQSSFYYQLWIGTWRSNFEQKTNGVLLACCSKRWKSQRPERIDFSVPRRALYQHSAWKKHQDAVFWVDIDLSIKERLTFYQTRSNAIILQGTLPAHCISRVERLKTGEMLYERRYLSPRPPPKISLKHDHNWNKGNDQSGSSVEQPVGKLVEQSFGEAPRAESSKPTQSKSNPISDRTVKPVETERVFLEKRKNVPFKIDCCKR